MLRAKHCFAATCVQTCKHDIDKLFNKRREMELQIMEAKQAREEEFQSELATVITYIQCKFDSRTQQQSCIDTFQRRRGVQYFEDYFRK